MNKQMTAILERLKSTNLESSECLNFIAHSFLLIKKLGLAEMKTLLANNKIEANYEMLSQEYSDQGISLAAKGTSSLIAGGFLIDLLNLFEAEVINFSDMADAVNEMLSEQEIKAAGGIKVPEELYDLGGAALGNKTESVYCPFDLSYEFAERLAKTGDVAYETRNAQVYFVADVRSKLLDCSYAKQLSDPVYKPSFIASGGLKLFQSAVAFPDLIVKYPTPEKLNDIWDRFPEKSFTGDVYHLRHMLAQTTDRVVAFVAAGFLSRATAGEKKFKQSILNNNWLEAVVFLPSHTLMPYVGVNMSMIVLDKKRTEKYVKFIDASTHFEQVSKREIKFVGLEQITEFLNAKQSADKVTLVTPQEIESNEYDLSVPRYVFSQEDQVLHDELEKYELANLEDVVELIRPQAVKSIEDGQFELVEINISSFNEIGEYNGTHKVIKQDTDPANKSSRASKQFLQENDVLIASKGSIGRIGLVEKLPAELTIAGQSFMIARVNPNQKGVTALSLYQFLNSKLGNEQLQRVQSGATIPFINIKDLKGIKVPLASQKQLDEAKQLRVEVKENYQKIEELKASLDQLTKDRWF